MRFQSTDCLPHKSSDVEKVSNRRNCTVFSS
jgi:hypothetical protein